MNPEDGPFALAKYIADRTHELEVDKVTSRYEIALVQALFVLNGGSATAFLAFLGSNTGSAVQRAAGWVMLRSRYGLLAFCWP